MKLSIVIPVYKSAQILSQLYTSLAQYVPAYNPDFQRVLVNDSRDDETWTVISELLNSYNRATGI